MQKEFSYPLVVSELPQAEQHYELNATKENCVYLKDVLQVPDVKNVKADIRLKNSHADHRLQIWGHINAELVLESVISLDLFSQKYDFDFSYVFDTQATYASQHEQVEEWSLDMPDVVIGDKIDLGDIVIEQIALKIDDYPRKKGEKFQFEAEFDAQESKNNPFEVLAKLKK